MYAGTRGVTARGKCVRTRSPEGTSCVSQVLAGDHGRDGNQLSWLANFDDRHGRPRVVVFCRRWRCLARLRYLCFASPDRAAHRPDRKDIAMDILAGIIMLAVVILFVGIALDAARRAK